MKVTREQMLTMKRYLFREGVCLVEARTKDLHPELQIDQEQVMKFMTSFLSKGYVEKYFIWHHAYFILNDEGIIFLRENLCLGDNAMPSTHSDETFSGVYEIKGVLNRSD